MKENEEEIVKLPPKWKVKENKLVGYDFLDEENNIQLQNSKDNNITRKFCWAIYNTIKK